MYTKATYLNKINKHLMLLALEVRSKNKLGLTDDSKLSEDFFCGLVNLVCGYNLSNLNAKKKNYDGIDLGDGNARVCVQVTAENSSGKVQDTLDSCNGKNREKEYDILIVLIIGFKKGYTKKFVSNFASFNKDECIWDIDTISKKIYDINDMSLLAKIVEHLDTWLDTIIKIHPLELTEEDLSVTMDCLLKYIEEELPQYKKGGSKEYVIPHRDTDFIKGKNALNSVTDVFFDAEISPSLQYAKTIDNFLGNPINKDFQKQYFIVTESIQSFYAENPDQFSSLESLFSTVFRQIMNWDNRNKVMSQKLLIILNNMYFNCDLGSNPS